MLSKISTVVFVSPKCKFLNLTMLFQRWSLTFFYLIQGFRAVSFLLHILSISSCILSSKRHASYWAQFTWRWIFWCLLHNFYPPHEPRTAQLIYTMGSLVPCLFYSATLGIFKQKWTVLLYLYTQWVSSVHEKQLLFFQHLTLIDLVPVFAICFFSIAIAEERRASTAQFAINVWQISTIIVNGLTIVLEAKIIGNYVWFESILFLLCLSRYFKHNN